MSQTTINAPNEEVQRQFDYDRFGVCAVVRRRFSGGCKSHPAIAPAGSNRSSHGGDEMAEAFGERVTNW